MVSTVLVAVGRIFLLWWPFLLYMALFAGVIFGEKIWSKGIWSARTVGLILAIVGIMAIFGSIIITTTGISNNSLTNRTADDMHTGGMNMNMDMSKNKIVLPTIKKSTPTVMSNMSNL
jgi:hypothetical protein